ncbi:MAG TPA: hypothetical protein VMZ29_03685 [Candidatus Bathyarchaeia archaeon]|nr:hypothetical protein [Candidatus Bathyarchaeia archaeon]
MGIPTAEIVTIIGLSIIILVGALMLFFIMVDVFKIRNEKAERARKKIRESITKKNIEEE